MVVVGVDFDNTIVNYQDIFHRVAYEWKVIPPELPSSKKAVRDHLRDAGLEDKWTLLQGYVYGCRMQEASMYPGVREFFDEARAQGISVKIVSHKTQRPYAGEPYDLHRAARDWLLTIGLTDPSLIDSDVFFEVSKADKIKRIETLKCDVFIDDLPEFLAEALFPTNVKRYLFDPDQQHIGEDRFLKAETWSELRKVLLDPYRYG